MRQLLLATETEIGRTVRIESGDYHYLTHVLRFSEGDVFTVLDTAGQAFSARVLSIRDRHLDALVEASAGVAMGAGWAGQVTVLQALPKGRKLDDVIRHAVQAGATRIVPLLTERTVARADDSQYVKLDRWRRIAREAVQQSGAQQPVEVSAPVKLTDLAPCSDSLCLFLHTAPIAQQTLHGYLDRVPERVELAIGPEGGFSQDEITHMTGLGFHPLYLGQRVLRTESAALFALGAVQILIQERDSWQPIE